MEARRMEGSPRTGNLRIIEEIYDEKFDSTRIRTIYRDKGFQKKFAKITESTRIKEKSIQTHEMRERNYKTSRQKKQKNTTSVTKIVLSLMLIAIVGVAGMLAQQNLSKMN